MIKEKYIQVGQQVKQGDLLYLIDPSPYQASVDKAKAIVALNKANLVFAKRKLDRYAELIRGDFVPKLTIEEYTKDLETGENQVISGQAQLALAEIRLNECKITSPIMYMLHYTIDNLSVLAFILAIGFIIDDAIVVLEDIVRRIETGQSVRSATIRGAYRIGFTIISMTFSLVATFIPLVLMEGLIRKIFQEFAITLITITLISGVISLTITPMLCSLLLKNSSAQGARTRMERVAGSVNNWLLRLYNPALRWILDHGIFALLTIPITLGCIVYFLASIPVDFLPNDNVGLLIGYTQGEDGISSSQMFEHQKKLLHILQEDPQERA